MSTSHTVKANRWGYDHQYTLDQDRLEYSAGTRGQFSAELKKLNHLKDHEDGGIQLRFSDNRKITLWLEESELRSFFKLLLNQWHKNSPGNCLKALFDYSTSFKAQALMWISLSLLFPGGLATFLLFDGYKAKSCDAALESGVAAPATLQKIKKDRRGNWVWFLEFKTQNGETITGHRNPYYFEKEGAPQGTPTVIYSPQNPKCWDLSTKENVVAPNMRHRLFATFLQIRFGWAFVGTTILGILWGIRKLFLKNRLRDIALEFLETQTQKK